jgi:hypothetical protein
MQIPAFDAFRKERDVLYGRPWSIDPAGASFTLTIPDADVVFEDEDDDGLRPDEPSYRMALRVLGQLDGFREKAAEYLARIVDARRFGMHGASYFNHVACDARAKTVTVAMAWETDIYSEWSVTFVWPEWESEASRGYHAIGMGYRSR